MSWKLILTLFLGFIRWCGAFVLTILAFNSYSSWNSVASAKSNKAEIRTKQLETQLSECQSHFKKSTDDEEKADSLAKQSFILRQLQRLDAAETTLKSSLALTKDTDLSDRLKADLAGIQRDNQEFDAAIATLSDLISRDKNLNRNDLLKRNSEHLAVVQKLKSYSRAK